MTGISADPADPADPESGQQDQERDRREPRPGIGQQAGQAERLRQPEDRHHRQVGVVGEPAAAGKRGRLQIGGAVVQQQHPGPGHHQGVGGDRLAGRQPDQRRRQRPGDGDGERRRLDAAWLAASAASAATAAADRDRGGDGVAARRPDAPPAIQAPAAEQGDPGGVEREPGVPGGRACGRRRSSRDPSRAPRSRCPWTQPSGCAAARRGPSPRIQGGPNPRARAVASTTRDAPTRLAASSRRPRRVAAAWPPRGPSATPPGPLPSPGGVLVSRPVAHRPTINGRGGPQGLNLLGPVAPRATTERRRGPRRRGGRLARWAAATFGGLGAGQGGSSSFGIWPAARA